VFAEDSVIRLKNSRKFVEAKMIRQIQNGEWHFKVYTEIKKIGMIYG